MIVPLFPLTPLVVLVLLWRGEGKIVLLCVWGGEGGVVHFSFHSEEVLWKKE